MKNIIEHYENYDEDSRLVRDNSHRLEFITTTYMLDSLLNPNSKILDMGAATGRYSFYLASKGHTVTAYELVGAQVDFMKNKLNSFTENISLDIQQGDGRDLSRFEDESFDVVLCFGPLYHLINSEDREKCIKESLRVLKKGGIIAAAYVNKFAIFSYLVKGDTKFLKETLMTKVLDNSCITAEDEDCFWTDAYFCSPEEIEVALQKYGARKITNVATDGTNYLMSDRLNSLTESEFNIWVKYHLKTCSEPSLLGSSMHGLYIGEKQ